MDVLVTVRSRIDGSRQQLTVNVASCETVRDVGDKVNMNFNYNFRLLESTHNHAIGKQAFYG